MSINNVVIMGRVCETPTLKTTSSGLSVTSFTVAVDRRFQKQGEEKQADFLNVVAWRQTADFVCKYFNKGSMIAVQGELQTRNYEDKNGNKRVATEIVADNVSFCGGKKDSAAAEPAGGDHYDYDFTADDEDDLPY